MKDIYKDGGLVWNYGFFEEYLMEPFPQHNAQTLHEDTFGHVAVTIVAFPRNDPESRPKLVLATGGLSNMSIDNRPGNKYRYVYHQQRNATIHSGDGDRL